jgi:hypothetical protein
VLFVTSRSDANGTEIVELAFASLAARQQVLAFNQTTLAELGVQRMSPVDSTPHNDGGASNAGLIAGVVVVVATLAVGAAAVAWVKRAPSGPRSVKSEPECELQVSMLRGEDQHAAMPDEISDNVV